MRLPSRPPPPKKPRAFGGFIFLLESPQRIAARLRQDLFPREQQNRHAPQALAGLLVVLDLADQGHAGTAALFLQLEVERVIPGLVEGLSAQALLGTYACGQGFAETVVEQPHWNARQDLHPLWLLQDLGATQRVLRNLNPRIVTGSRGQLA